jgi:hypothetical protein
MRALFASLLCLAACASAQSALPPAPADCPPDPLADAARASAAHVPLLAGSFRVVEVLTSFGTDSTELHAWRLGLTLALADSATVADSRVRRFGHFPRAALQLTGSVRWPGIERSDTAEVDGLTLYLGCRDCLDASPDILTITHAGSQGFWGQWANRQSGVGRAADPRTGEWLPNPAGYFCAWRVTPELP